MDYKGADLIVHGIAPTEVPGGWPARTDFFYLFAKHTDPVIIANLDKIRDFGYITHDVRDMINKSSETTYANVAGLEFGDYKDKYVGLLAINPSTIFDDAVNLDKYDKTTGLTSTEQLYTARGSQSVSATTKMAMLAGANVDDYKSVFLLEEKDYGESNARYLQRMAWTSSTIPLYGFADEMFTYSIPRYTHMA